MPIEYIRKTATDVDGTEHRLGVGWNQVGEVQIATEEKFYKSAFKDIPEGSSLTQYYRIDNRRAVNELIKTLRNARDKAFGKDE